MCQLSLQGEAEQKAPEEDYYIYANVLLNWGNILYERSQLAARAGQVCRRTHDADAFAA